MKYFFSTILFLHGLIHLMGFAKGFFPDFIAKLNLSVSHSSAVLWLTTTLLFIVSGFLFLQQKTVWFWLASFAVMFSFILILTAWNETKFGLLPNIIVVIGIAIAASNNAFDKMIEAEKNALFEFDTNAQKTLNFEADLDSLPAPVKRWLKVSGVNPEMQLIGVELFQDFKMKLKPKQNEWYAAHAAQLFNVHEPGFVWTVKMAMNPLMQVRGRDKFYSGKGTMTMRMNGIIPLGNETGSKMDEGTLQRFLGEIVWFPNAAIRKYIRWESLSDSSVEAIMEYKGTQGSGIFYFDDEGKFTRFEAMRYMGNKPEAKKYLWEIRATQHAVFNGITVPSKCEAIWHLDEGEWKWCEIEITELNFFDEVKHL